MGHVKPLLFLGWFGISASWGGCSLIPKFYTILDDGVKKNEVKTLCQHVVWILTADGLVLCGKVLRPITHGSL